MHPGYLDMRYQVNVQRLQAFGPEVDPTEIEAYLKAWDVICQGKPEGGPISDMDPANRFRWLTATRSTILQCSRVHPGLCTQPAAKLDDLFTKYVL